MNVLEGVFAGITAIVGLVIFYAIYTPYAGNLAPVGGLLLIIPIVIVASVIIYILIRSFGGG